MCRLSDHTVKTVFNNTTLDCADTYRIVNKHKNDWIITTPPEGFYQYVERENFIPTRFSRACCSLFKEGNHINHFDDVEKAIWIMGVRNDESNARSSRQDIEHNPKCGKSTWYLDKHFYPKMYDRWHRILTKDFIEHGKWCTLNCTLKEYQHYWNGGVVREQPTKEVIEEFMQYKSIDSYEIAEKYFNKKCTCCGKNIRNKDTIAMNLKMHGRNITRFMCKKCLMKELHIDAKKWNEYIRQFKSQGCSLF